MIEGAADVAPVSTMASAMMFGSIMFAAVALATRSYLLGDSKVFAAASNVRSSALDISSLPSVYTLLYHFSIFGMILFYAYICEYHPPFAHSDKNYDADMFFFLTFMLFVVSFFTWKKHVPDTVAQLDKKLSNGDAGDNEPRVVSTVKPVAEANDKTEILNRDQTEEWKGWMQFMFLLYHYYHAEDVYNSIRIMITCYVWMTGFGNFSFFYLKSDFSSIRVMQMLWRLNFLVLFLCLTQGTTFILYYICLLHTYYFFMVYGVMRIGASMNHTKWWIRIKLAILAVVIFLVWDCDLGLFKLIHFPFFGEHAKMGAGNGSMWEWYFRSTLDHWSTYLGMIFALNFPITSLFYRKLEAQPLVWHVLGKGAVGAALFSAFWMWCTGPFMQEKLEYNQTNAYFGFIPLITYIYFRNLTPWLRNHTLELLHQIGKTTLETYLMQHHIWLTSNAKSLLTLVPGWPKVNFLLVSLLYVFLSRRLYQLTLFLRGMVLPDNRSICIRNLGVMGATVGFFCSLAAMLDKENLLCLKAVLVVAVATGYLLYNMVLSTTIRPGDQMPEIESDKRSSGGAVNIFAPYTAGVIMLLLTGMSWNHMALKGSTKIKALPANCQAFANDGQWVALNGCDEGSRGDAYRKSHIAAETTCSSQNNVYVWGWEQQDAATHCRFKQRDIKSLQKTLNDRKIVFVGDSITRYLYHSFRRQLGDKDAGKYDASVEKHVNYENRVGSTSLDFVWAAKADEVTEAAKKVPSGRPDLVVLGGGAWDKLYNSDNETDLRESMKKLASQIEKLKGMDIPVVWVTPTTINSDALPSAEKQDNMKESEMAKMRGWQERDGITSAASFVLDGTSFTASRAAEAFDGVHYPHNVYSAGAQILANSLDWLLPSPVAPAAKKTPQPGAMAHVPLGLMILVFAFFGIFCFDGFMGFSYLAAIFVPSVAPCRLYGEAFSTLHRKKGLPAIEMAPASAILPVSSPSAASTPCGSVHEEEVSLIGKES